MRRLLLLTLLLVLPSAVLAQPTAIVGGTVHPVSGPTIENGVVVLDGDSIAAVGARADVPIPEGARRVDASGQVVTPGFIDAATATGLVEVSAVGDTRDAALDGDPIRAAFRITDGINPNSTVIPVTRLGGVTTVAAVPSGGIISGQSTVLDLVGDRLSDMHVPASASMVASFTPDAADAAGGSRGGISLRLREAFDDAHFYAQHTAAFNRGEARPMSVSRLDLEALQPVLAGEQTLMVRAARASDIDAALRLADAHDLRLVLVGGHEAWMRADVLADANVPVVLKPLTNLPTEFDRLGSRFDNAALLAEAGVPVVLSSFDTHNARNLRFEAGNAIRYGLDRTTALRGVTQTAAEALGIADTHGSLESGKTANVVVWSGDPFEFSTAPEHVFIRGQEIESTSRQQRLLERYRTLSDEPPQYR
jgi:imidazolonepropionase-like amidohydrolase